MIFSRPRFRLRKQHNMEEVPLAALIARLPGWDQEESDDAKLRAMDLDPDRLRRILREAMYGTNEHTPADAPGFSGTDNYNTIVRLMTLATQEGSFPGWKRTNDHNQALFVHDRGDGVKDMQILVSSSNPGGARKGAHSTTKNDKGEATRRRIDESLGDRPPAQPSLFDMAQSPSGNGKDAVPLWFLVHEIGEGGTCCASLKLATGYGITGGKQPSYFPSFDGEQISIIDEKGGGPLSGGYNEIPDRGIDPAGSAISITRKE